MIFERMTIRRDSTRQAPIRCVVLTLFRFAIGASLLIYLATSAIVDFRALSKLFTTRPITFAAVTLLLIHSALMSVRLSWLFRPRGMNPRFGTSLKLSLVGFFFATFLPGAAGGALSKLFYTTRGNGGRRIEIMTVVLLDRAIGLFSLLLLPLIFVPMFSQRLRNESALRSVLLTVGLLALGMTAGFLACLFSDRFMVCIPSITRNRLTENRIVRQIQGTITTYRKNSRVLFQALGVSLLANFLLVLVTMLCALAVTPSRWTPRMFLVVPVGHIVNSLPLTPGGLGVGETAFNALFNLTGLGGGADALLCTRIWTAIVGLIGFSFYLRGFSREVFDELIVTDEPSSAVLGTVKS